MNNRIEQALEKKFEQYRIVFWYDAKKELRDNYEALNLPDVEKIELKNNEFGIKHKILREQPKQKFLLYSEGPQPPDLDNWLLDVLLGHSDFRADQIGLWLSELELDVEFSDIVKEHNEFFRVAKRKEKLKKLLKSDDTKELIRLKILAVCANSEPRIDAIMEQLLSEITKKNQTDDLFISKPVKTEKFNLLKRCKLDSFLWDKLKKNYKYNSPEPGIKDFAIQLFKDCYYQSFDSSTDNSEALLFLKRWKDSRKFESSFEMLSNKCANILGIEQDLNKRDFKELIELDFFRLIDQKIISDLVKAISMRTVSSGDVALWIRQRRQGHWYESYQYLYKALDYSAQFIHTLDKTTLTMNNIKDGINNYTKHGYKLDQIYRKFIYNVRISNQPSLLKTLTDQIENLYSNNYLLKLNDRWQSFINSVTEWNIPENLMQFNFYNNVIEPLNKKGKVCVIISDALRYEIGEELANEIRSKNAYTVSIDSAISMLPSYTQLGMAALLPHKTLQFTDNESGQVLIDDRNSVGLAARSKIIKTYCPESTAVKAEDILNFNRDELRSIMKNNQIIYIYHNRIDATGHDKKTESNVFEAVEKSISDLSRIITRLGGENYIANFVITADHGFIYQNAAIDESDFTGCDAEGDHILFKDRRFVLGRGLKESPSLCKFESLNLGLKGDMEVLIPKSINRLRLKGACSRFVHGGASLQELIIPVIKIKKKRSNDVSLVDVEILPGSTSTITSSQLAVTLYQTQALTDKVHLRKLNAGIYNLNGDLISDSHELTFDLTSDNPRERELQVRFLLNRKAEAVNNEQVILKLMVDRHEIYKSSTYHLKRSFTNDFDI